MEGRERLSLARRSVARSGVGTSPARVRSTYGG